MTSCPTTLDLELQLALPGGSAAAEHVERCDACRRRVAEMRLLGDEFRRDVLPATIDAVRAAAERRQHPPRWRLDVMSAAGAKRLLRALRSPQARSAHADSHERSPS